MEKASLEFKDSKLMFGVDTDKDGQKSVEGKLCLNEALGEAFFKGKKVEGAKVVDFRFEMTQMILVVDTDKDGESLLELKINLGESVDEVSQLFKK